MNTEALALELRDEMYSFLNELIDEFGTEGNISHDTFNKAINIRSNIIADSDLWEGKPVADTESKCNKQSVSVAKRKFIPDALTSHECDNQIYDGDGVFRE